MRRTATPPAHTMNRDPFAPTRALLLAAWLLSLVLPGLPVHAAPAAASAASASPVPVPLRLTEAEVTHDGGATWLAVSLPDRWARRGQQGRADAQYRLQVDLASVPTLPMALAFDRLSSHHRISLNGQLLRQRGDGPEHVNRRIATPTLVDLPPALLRAGRNELLIEVQHPGKGELSAALLGPTDRLRRAQALEEVVSVDLPQFLNLGSLGLALFMLTV